MADYKINLGIRFKYDSATGSVTKFQCKSDIIKMDNNQVLEMPHEPDLQNMVKLILSSYTGNTNPAPTTITLTATARSRLATILTKYNI